MSDECLPPDWGSILTIKVSRNDDLWAAWTDDVNGLLVVGCSLDEVLSKFSPAKVEIESARDDKGAQHG